MRAVEPAITSVEDFGTESAFANRAATALLLRPFPALRELSLGQADVRQTVCRFLNLIFGGFGGEADGNENSVSLQFPRAFVCHYLEYVGVDVEADDALDEKDAE